MAQSIKLTYFNIEGAAEPVRLALKLSGTEFEDDRIGFAQWGEMKAKMPYGQLPIMTVDDGKVMTQSAAMVRHVGSKFSTTLYPIDKLYEIEEAIGMVEDLKRAWMPCLYVSMRPENFGYPSGYPKTDEGKETIKTMRSKFVAEELPKYLGYFEGMLKDNKWLVEGDEPTIADCFAVPALRAYTMGHIDNVSTDCLNTHPKVVAYVEKFCALTQLKGGYSKGLGANVE